MKDRNALHAGRDAGGTRKDGMGREWSHSPGSERFSARRRRTSPAEMEETGQYYRSTKPGKARTGLEREGSGLRLSHPACAKTYLQPRGSEAVHPRTRVDLEPRITLDIAASLVAFAFASLLVSASKASEPERLSFLHRSRREVEHKRYAVQIASWELGEGKNGPVRARLIRYRSNRKLNTSGSLNIFTENALQNANIDAYVS
ncbi:hypothetical protein B0H16DRAFT_1469854 [Mycena metata]|uniref:Uncharacterized protein n=1 Tax=Mycena metata TaxID=1033252 RepID=A0AAD7HWU3_9AGAR|nr:hypothetical protein B0H16DRAFT_1469854 [Mycena metata]